MIKFNKKINFLISIILIIQIIVSQSFAAFLLERSWNTRARGMGKAFTAIANDAGALTFNNAGLGYIDWIETNFMYSKLFTGLDTVNMGTNFAGAIIPLKDYGTIGVNWARFSSKDLYQEDCFQLGYGYLLSDIFSVGAGIDYLSNKYILKNQREKDDPLFINYGTSANAIAFNIGTLYKPLDYLAVGFSARNINEPSIGLKDKDKVPAEYRLGFALEAKRITFPLDVYYRNQTWGAAKDKIGYSLGAEYWIADILGLRAGFNKNEMTCGISLFKNGLFNINETGFDTGIEYALAWPLGNSIEETSGSHQVAVVFRYGKGGKIKEDYTPNVGAKKFKTVPVKNAAKLFTKTDPRIKVYEGILPDTSKVAILLIYGKEVIKLHKGIDVKSPLETLNDTAIALTKIMRSQYNLVDSDFKIAESNGLMYVQIKGLNIIAVDNEASYLNSSRQDLATMWINQLKNIMLKDAGKQESVKYGTRIEVRKVYSFSGQVAEIRIDGKTVVSLFVTLDGVTPYERAKEAGKKIAEYLNSKLTESSIQAGTVDDLYYIYIDGKELLPVDYDAEYIGMNTEQMATEWQDNLKSAFRVK
jgi:hypothetical protein